MTRMHFPRRRWFRFSLRTLFIAMTAIDLGLTWETRFIRERQRMVRLIVNEKRGKVRAPIQRFFMTSKAEISYWREFLGDRAVGSIILFDYATDSELRAAKELFPEAVVYRSLSPAEREEEFRNNRPGRQRKAAKEAAVIGKPP